LPAWRLTVERLRLTAGRKVTKQMMDRPRLIVMTAILWGALLLPAATLALSLTKNQDLEFGSMAGGSGLSGTVTIDPSGGRHASGSVRPLGSQFAPARFSLYGTPGESYRITLPSTLTMASAGDQMEVSAVTCSVPVSGTLPPGGYLAIAVGGTLTVKPAQRASTYLGTFSLSVDGN